MSVPRILHNLLRRPAIAGLFLTTSAVLSACYMPGAREAIEKQKMGEPTSSESTGEDATSGSSNVSSSGKKSNGAKAVAGASGGSIENLPALSDLMKPPAYNPKWDDYMPHNRGGSPGKTFYIAEDGNDSNPGTEEKPWASLQKAADTLEPGQTVLVKNGVYDETDLGPKNWQHTNIRKSGKPGQYITYKNYPGHTPTIFVRSWNGVQINGASYIHIEGFEVRGIDDPKVDDTENPEHFGNGISVIDTDNKDLPVTKSHHLRIVGNHIHHVGGNGIAAAGGLIAGNIIHHVSHRSSAGNSCISTGGNQKADSGTVGAFSTVIAGNILYNCVNLHKFKAAGMITDGNGVIVDYMKDVPFYNTNGKRILIANNIAFNNGGRGFHVYKSGYVDIVHNLAFGNLRSEPLKNEAELSAINSEEVRFVGNIAIATDRHHLVGDGQSKNISWTKNILVGKNLLRVKSHKKKHATDIFNEDPNWLKLKNLSLDPSVADFRPTSESPFFDMIEPSPGITLDYFGKARRQGDKADAGPIEFER